MADDNILEVGALVDVAAIQEGMAASASAVEASTSTMNAAFEATASTTEAADLTMIEAMAGLTAAVDALAATFSSLPAKVAPPVEETEGILTGLEGKFVELAEVGNAATEGLAGGIGGLAKLLGAGALIGVLGHMADSLNKNVLELGHLSEKAGISISSLAGLQEASEELGIEFGAVEQAMVRLGRAQTLAAEGGKQQIAAFQRIGISIEQVKSSTPEELFNAVSEAIKNTTSTSDAAATAFALLGRGGATLIPIFKEYGASLGEVMRQQGEETGITREAYEDSLQFQKAQAQLGEEFRRLALEVMPSLTRALHEIQTEFKSLTAGGSLDELSAWGGKVAAVFDELQGTANAAGVMMRDVFTKLPGLPSDAALARHQELAKELDKIWKDTAAKVNADLGNIQPGTVEDQLQNVLKLAEAEFPTRRNVPGEGGAGAEKANEEKALAEATLQTQLAAIKEWQAQQQAAYAQGKIGAEDLANVQISATNQELAVQEAYFSKLKAIYANDPAKESVVVQQQLKFEYEASAKSSESYAAAQTHLNEVSRQYAAEVAESVVAVQKEIDEQLKATSKSVQDYVNSVKALGAAQAASKGADFSAQEEAVRNLSAQGLITERERATQLAAIYRDEADQQVSTLREQLDRQEAMLRAAEAERTAAESSGNAARLNEARAAYNNQLAAVTDTQNKISQAITQANNKIDAENQRVYQSYVQTYNRITGQINSAISGWITGHMTFSKAVASVWQGILGDAVNAILRIGEKWLLQHIIMKAINLAFHVDTLGADASAAAAHAAVTSTTNVAQATSDAGLAAAGQFAWYSAVFPPIAPAMAAAAYATGLGFAGLAAFEKGGISEGGLSLLHPEEMVLPPKLSAGVQDIINNGGSSTTNNITVGSNSAEAQTAGETHIHIHQGDVQALDTKGVSDVLHRNRRDLLKTIQRGISSGHLDVRGVYK